MTQRMAYNPPPDTANVLTKHDVLIYLCAFCAGGRWPHCDRCQSTGYIGIRTDSGRMVDWSRVQLEGDGAVVEAVREVGR